MGNGATQREFDIITQNKWVECKNLNWEKIDTVRDITRYKTNFQQQKLIAQHHNKFFELYSKQPIPTSWKEWFKTNNIIFYEG